MRFPLRIVATVACLGLFAAQAARAQVLPSERHNAADLSIEYGFARITNGGGVNMPVGAAATLGLNISDSLAIAGDIRWNRKTEEGVALTLMSFQAGPRLAFRGEGATPYIQALAGLSRTSAGLSDSGFSFSVSETKFSVMPGVGLDIPIGEQLAFRAGADFRLVFTEHEKEKDILVHAGIVLHFGRR
jgi:hypothetical protein